MKRLYSTLVFLLFSYSTFGQSSSMFSKEAVLEDLDYLYTSLKDAHYNLYAYTSKETFDSAYSSIKNSIQKDSLSLLETSNLYQKLAAFAKNGHTGITFPIQSYGEYVYAGGTLFPLEIAFEDNKPLIRKNWSDNQNIKIGSEVLSINGKSINEVLAKIYPQISAERLYFKNVKIELLSFPRFYWQMFGKQDSFEIEVKEDGKTQKYTLKAVKGIEEYEMKRNEIINPSRELKFIKKSAYLHVGNFSGDEKLYQNFIDSAFTEIKKQKSKNLIIDIRNHGGGDDSFSDYLISYFANKPFKWNSEFTLKTSKFLKEHTRQNFDTTEVYWQKVLTKKDGEIYKYEFEEYQPQTKKKRFKGKVYVLVNRQSHSQSAVTAAQIQDYDFATIVGEETGDYPSLYASIFQYSLPNTKIPIAVSKGYIVRINGSKKQEGVIPDIIIKDYLLDEDDEILNELLKKINDN
ncbi:S41 family peptidase [Bernardetia sp. ABR2-2B]|uniref:S41 family peptidase n=1 Tax=Bernardetia sp. ABR2-2B TaxID=3127472 RepID=UPI0030CC063C